MAFVFGTLCLTVVLFLAQINSFPLTLAPLVTSIAIYIAVALVYLALSRAGMLSENKIFKQSIRIGYFLLGNLLALYACGSITGNLRATGFELVPGIVGSLLFTAGLWNEYVVSVHAVVGAVFFDVLAGVRCVYRPATFIKFPWERHERDLSTEVLNIKDVEKFPTEDGGEVLIEWSINYKFDNDQLDRALELSDDVLKNGVRETASNVFAIKIAETSSKKALAESQNLVNQFERAICDNSTSTPTPFEAAYALKVENTTMRVRYSESIQKARDNTDVMQRLKEVAAAIVAADTNTDPAKRITMKDALDRAMVAHGLIKHEINEGKGDPLAQLIGAIRGDKRNNSGGKK